jgi:hypothetical protein
MPQDQTVNLNCQTDAKMRADLYALAKRHERSASAEIRLAIRAWLARDQSPAHRRQRKTATS